MFGFKAKTRAAKARAFEAKARELNTLAEYDSVAELFCSLHSEACARELAGDLRILATASSIPQQVRDDMAQLAAALDAERETLPSGLRRDNKEFTKEQWRFMTYNVNRGIPWPLALRIAVAWGDPELTAVITEHTGYPGNLPAGAAPPRPGA